MIAYKQNVSADAKVPRSPPLQGEVPPAEGLSPTKNVTCEEEHVVQISLQKHQLKGTNQERLTGKITHQAAARLQKNNGELGSESA